MAFKLASLFVEVEGKTEGLEGKLSGVKASLGGLASSMKGAATAGLWGLAATAVAGVGVGLGASVKAAGDLNESISKTGEVFGRSTGMVRDLASTMAGLYGSNQAEILDAASNIGLIAEGAGLAEPAAADLAVAMTKLADDASSFFNVDLATALEKIRAGLTGESEPLKAFGVLMNEDAVKAEALRLGLVKSSKELTENAKVMARASLIQKGLAKAQGDHERTGGGFNNQMKELSGRMANFGTAVGQMALPPLNLLLRVINPLASGLGTIMDGINDLAGGLAHFAGEIVGASSAWRTLTFGLLSTPKTVALPRVQVESPKAREERQQREALPSGGAGAAAPWVDPMIAARKVGMAEVAAEVAKADAERLAALGREAAEVERLRLYRERTDPAIRQVIGKQVGSFGANTEADRQAQWSGWDLTNDRKNVEAFVSLAKEKAGALRTIFAAVKQDGLAAAGKVLAATAPRATTLGGVTDQDSYARELQDGALNTQKTADEMLQTQKSMLDRLGEIAGSLAGDTRRNIASIFN